MNFWQEGRLRSYLGIDQQVNRAVKDTAHKVAQTAPIVALDVGARGGVTHDLGLLAPVTDYYCFEPDKEEFRRLQASFATSYWRSVTCINDALAAQDGTFVLNLTRQRGCSSKLTADPALADLFSRGDYYVHEGAVEVPARALDGLIAEGKVQPPSFMKIDVQGMEPEVFAGAVKALDTSLVGIRAEVSFFPIYRDQPLFAEIDQQLRPFGFVPMRWIEFHEWRRRTRVKYPDTWKGELPGSRGQMMHADVLYLLHPEALPSDTEAQSERLVRLGLVAACYDHIDHAEAAFGRPGIRQFVLDRASVDPFHMLEGLSQHIARRARHEQRMQRLGRWIARLSGAND